MKSSARDEAEGTLHQVKEWDAEIALFKAKTKVQELKTSGDEAWEAVKGNAEKT